ncbi:MAG: flagellar motor protein MotB [Desulfovibrio sp.]|jgi:chemotaxis protein MotB|nr:flagellar motor protein MotB [Desulfovibrio sp.]
MAGSSWKVAYADFMTAMMAFFLVMWLLNMAPPETLKGLSGYFQADAQFSSNTISPYGMSNNPLIQYVDKLDMREFKMSEIEESNYAIAQSLKQFLLKDAIPSASSGLTSDGVGVLLHITSDLMFKPGTVEFTPEGEKVMQEVLNVMHKYKVYLVVRGNADSSETGAPTYPSKWELSAARANSAVRWLIANGITPGLIRSVAYADTRPRVPSTIPGAAAQNSRVEFNFHRPEVMSTIVGY